MYAGGMLYFSSGSVIRGLRGAPACNAAALRAGVCPEAGAGASSDSRKAVRETKRRKGEGEKGRPRRFPDSPIRRVGFPAIRSLVTITTYPHLPFTAMEHRELARLP